MEQGVAHGHGRDKQMASVGQLIADGHLWRDQEADTVVACIDNAAENRVIKIGAGDVIPVDAAQQVDAGQDTVKGTVVIDPRISRLQCVVPIRIALIDGTDGITCIDAAEPVVFKRSVITDCEGPQRMGVGPPGCAVLAKAAGIKPEILNEAILLIEKLTVLEPTGRDFLLQETDQIVRHTHAGGSEEAVGADGDNLEQIGAKQTDSQRLALPQNRKLSWISADCKGRIKAIADEQSITIPENSAAIAECDLP